MNGTQLLFQNELKSLVGNLGIFCHRWSYWWFDDIVNKSMTIKTHTKLFQVLFLVKFSAWKKHNYFFKMNSKVWLVFSASIATGEAIGDLMTLQTNLWLSKLIQNCSGHCFWWSYQLERNIISFSKWTQKFCWYSRHLLPSELSCSISFHHKFLSCWGVKTKKTGFLRQCHKPELSCSVCPSNNFLPKSFICE